MVLFVYLPAPSTSGWNNCADGHVANLGHARCHGSDIVIGPVSPPALPVGGASAGQRASAQAPPGAGAEQRLAEALVHEAVDDGVDAGRGVGEQVPGGLVAREPVGEGRGCDGLSWRG